MELSERLNAIRKIFTRRKTIELKPTIQPEEVDLLEQKYGFQLPEEYRAFITTLGNGATLQPISNDCDELCPLLGSGEINHFGSGENRQSRPDENRQSRVASPQTILFTRPAVGQPVSQ